MNALTPRKLWRTSLVGIGGLALAGMLAGHFSATADTRAAARSKPTVTFAKDIAPILYNNCTSCHRTGQVAPFSLSNYQDAKKRATQIASVVESHYMPPWHAESHGEFKNERKLTDAQIALLKDWADQGAKEGAGAPEPPKFSTDWTFGQPDLVLQPSKSYMMKADGADVYRCFVVPTSYTEDRYVSAIEVRPGNARIVHHVIAYLTSDGKARQMEADNKDGQPGYTSFGGPGGIPTGTLGGWAPGNFPRMLPDGVGTLLPKGSDVILQVHYHPSGKPETDLTKIGVYLCKKPVDKQLRVFPLFAGINIPPGEANYRVKSFELPVPMDATVLEVMPHMHLLGKEMIVNAEFPDGTTKTLVNVPHYDFSWQTTYAYKEPVKLPKGTKVWMTARYDNSTSNPRNPSSPPRKVGWGEQTTDEMSLAFLYYTVDAEHIAQGQPVTGLGIKELIQGAVRSRLKASFKANAAEQPAGAAEAPAQPAAGK